jgi:hypothetical protein
VEIRANLSAVKRIFLWLIASLCGLYLLVMGPLIDPIPFLDEATALAVLAYVLRALGYDVARWIPVIRHFRGRVPGPRGGPPPVPNGGRPQPKTAEKEGPVIDV